MMLSVQQWLTERGAEVTRLRTARGLSRQDLATLCNVHVVTIWRVENGKLPFNSTLAWKIAGALAVPMGELWAWPEGVPPVPTKEAVA